MNGARSKVRPLLADPKVTVVVVEHRDRLGRMNIELAEAALAAHGRRLVVLDDGEVDDDLVRDMVEVLTSVCVRRMGAVRRGTVRSRRAVADRVISARKRLSLTRGMMTACCRFPPGCGKLPRRWRPPNAHRLSIALTLYSGYAIFVGCRTATTSHGTSN